MSTQVKTGYPSIDKPWLEYYRNEEINTVLPSMSVYDYMRQCNCNNLHDVALLYYGRKITFDTIS